MDNFEMQIARQIQRLVDKVISYAEGRNDNAELRRAQFRCGTGHKDGEFGSEISILGNLDKIGKQGGETVPNLSLKYGQGTIVKRQRTRKDGSVYIWYQAAYFNEYGERKYLTDTNKTRLWQTLKELQRREKRPKNKILSLAEWLPAWYKKYRAPKNRPSTNAENERYIKQVAENKIGKMPFTSLNSEILQDYLMSLPRPNSRKKMYDIINAGIKKAQALGKLRLNPLADVELPSVKPKRRRAFTWAEQTAMIGALRQPYRDQLVFLFCTGLRFGELQALTANTFDFDDCSFYVHEQRAANAAVVAAPKTESSRRVVDYAPQLLELVSLDNVLKANYNAFKKYFKLALADLAISDLSPHCTRHTFASAAYKAGISDKQIQAWLGHSTLSMTTDTYTHIMGGGTSVIRDYMRDLKAWIEDK